jgi:very-short-patch-repair endonuclease
MLEYNLNLKEPSRALRKSMTDAERLLWSHLRGKQLLGVQFYRQKPIGHFIVDFYAPAAKLVIEVDGSQHSEPEHRQKDMARDQYLAQEGLMIMRFDNMQVLKETEAVLEEVFVAMQRALANAPGPLLQRGEVTS